jgi:hypothetical protein
MNMGWIMGFRNEIYEHDSVYNAEACYNSNRKTIYVILNDYKNNLTKDFTSVYNNYTSKSNILTKIYPNHNNKYILHENKRTYLGPQNIEKIEIRLVDEYEQLLDFRTLDYTFTFEFEYLYN